MKTEEEKIREIIKNFYPQLLECYPRAMFEKQLEKFIIKYFKLKEKVEVK